MSICKPCQVAADYKGIGKPRSVMAHPKDCGCTCQHKLPGSWRGEAPNAVVWVHNTEEDK